AGFGKVSSRASAGDAGSFTSLRPSSVNRLARFAFATAIAKSAQRRLRSITPTLLKCAQIVSNVWVFRCQRFEVANFDVSRFYTGPFGACTEKPAALSDHTRKCGKYCRESKVAPADLWANSAR